MNGTLPMKILCAATKFNHNGKDLIIPSPRHWDDILRDIVKCIPETLLEEEQGFIDQYGNFYNRKQALLIAKSNNQIVYRVGGDTNRLFSENLY